MERNVGCIVTQQIESEILSGIFDFSTDDYYVPELKWRIERPDELYHVVVWTGWRLKENWTYFITIDEFW